MKGTNLSRRGFLKATGWVAGGVTALSGCSLLPVLPSFGAPDSDDAVTWVQVRGDGTIVFYCPRAEMGQGITTGLTQVVAEELQVDPSRIDCRYPRTSDIRATPMTVGSQSMEQFFGPVAEAAARIREELARRAGVDRTAPIEDGGFRLSDGSLQSIHQLVRTDEAEVLEFDPQAEPPRLLSKRPREARQAVGHSHVPVHVERIVTGAETYSRDVFLPEMTFGVVARPPHLGARLLGWDAVAAGAVPGVLAVVEGPARSVGVVAETPMAARQGRDALRCEWSPLTPQEAEEILAPLDIDRAIETGQLDHTPIDEGSQADGVDAAAHSVELRIDTPMVAHACLEPRAGVARCQGERCEVWTASQDPWFVERSVARATGLSDVVVHTHRIGGAFGGRVLCQASIEAAWLAQGSGRTVKVQWSREEEFTHNYVGPQFSHRIRAGVDAEGSLSFWNHQMVGSPILTSSLMVPDSLHWAADLPPDPGTWRGTDLPYRVPHRRVEFADVRKPMPTGPWRGLGAAPNTFAVECAIDELTEKAELAPLAFRIEHARSDRLRHVLQELAGWIDGESKESELGIAAAAYKDVTFVAIAARVSDGADGPRVEQMWCVQDCGQVVSPDQVQAQIEGNLVWGISMAFRERFELAEGTVRTQNFDRYAIARNSDVPALRIRSIESSEAPSGSGEAAFAPAAAAIVNALSRLRGERIYSLPVAGP